MDNIRKVFAYRLKERRGDLTQEAYSAKLRIPLRTYQKFEAGVVPQKKTMAALVRKLGLVSETPLFQDPDLAPPPPRGMESFRLRVFARLASMKDDEFEAVADGLAEMLGVPLEGDEIERPGQEA